MELHRILCNRLRLTLCVVALASVSVSCRAQQPAPDTPPDVPATAAGPSQPAPEPPPPAIAPQTTPTPPAAPPPSPARTSHHTGRTVAYIAIGALIILGGMAGGFHD